MTIDNKIKKVRSYFKDALNYIILDNDHKIILDSLYKFVDHMMDNLEKDKMIIK